MTSPASATVTLHFALGVPSRELALEVSDGFYDAMVRARRFRAEADRRCSSTVQGFVLVCVFPWCLTKALVAPVHRPGWLYAPGTLCEPRGGFWPHCVARGFHFSRFRLPHAFLRFGWPVASSPSV